MSKHDIKELLINNEYPGRGIVTGQTEDGKCAVAAYFIMGRSENSRNRVFVREEDTVMIHPFDPAKLSDPSLVIYAPLRTFKNNLIVTNGDQTDTIYASLSVGGTFDSALQSRRFEPDAPNFTPRISAMLTFTEGAFSYKMSILKSADESGTKCSRFTFDYEPLCGTGHFIHTYRCDGNPIPSFTGEPSCVTVPDDIDTFTNDIWKSLNPQNKVSLYVRYTYLETGGFEDRLINKNKRKVI